MFLKCVVKVMLLTVICFSVSCGGVLWPGATELHAGGPGKPERYSHQWQPNLTGFCFSFISFLFFVEINCRTLQQTHSANTYCCLQPKTKCEPYALTHGDEVKMGETVLSFHIHSGTDTCDGCEPGQIIAHLSKYKREEKTGERPEKKTIKNVFCIVLSYTELRVVWKSRMWFTVTDFKFQITVFPPKVPLLRKRIKKHWGRRSWSRLRPNMASRYELSQAAAASFSVNLLIT